MVRLLERLDRRWIFLAMALAVAIPILLGLRFPESVGSQARDAFRTIEELPEGSRVLLSFDYDPASEGELQPMANAFVHHAASRGHKLYFMALWPLGSQKVKETVDAILKPFHPDYVEGRDYLLLGFKAGNEGVIKVASTSLKQAYPTIEDGTQYADVPMLAGVTGLAAMDLVINVSAGYPGTKEWVQYCISPLPGERLVCGTTGVQAVNLYPYYPGQIVGMLGAIKGAAEYEVLVNEKYPGPDGRPIPLLLEGQRRMGPQLTAHLLVITLIILGNIVYFATRKDARTGGSR
jgi:hypothetical protein